MAVIVLRVAAIVVVMQMACRSPVYLVCLLTGYAVWVVVALGQSEKAEAPSPWAAVCMIATARVVGGDYQWSRRPVAWARGGPNPTNVSREDDRALALEEGHETWRAMLVVVICSKNKIRGSLT